MDYALLAATALGAIGLYLMMPRERASLARLGGLLATMAVAGLFLYFLRTANSWGGDGAGGGPPVYFYVFAFIMIAGAVGVITQPRPVYAALYFVLVTLAGAGTFVLLMADFMAIVLVIIYAGAILVTYVFVIMLASQSASGAAGGVATRSPEYDRRASEPFVAVLVAFVLIGTVLQVLFPVHNDKIRRIADRNGPPDVLMARNLGMTMADIPTTAPAGPVSTYIIIEPATQPSSPVIASATMPSTMPADEIVPSNVQVLGANLYSRYALTLELAGILLTIALVGAVVIARKNSGLQELGTGRLPTE